ncbi:hypothetical protein D6D12_09148 [Aureobasidium pullulans]|uniref:Protection of telomeres protein 1 n=1 Tax=Aureobasidium pullulans TaxID=5580 RepID=A0AB74JGY3_AURPU|nr:hypothetical protein D6D12_09148 [Aureobasidium pullulans]THX63621.1 hypothetical protein D6D11_01688 [Aureobasidium pullulans]
MAPPRPNTLTSLADAYNNFQAQSPPVINLMGIVVDILPPTINQKSKDWQMTFTIQDAEMMKIPSRTKGLKARFFVQYQSELPQIRSVGDIILIRSCKVTSVYGTPMIGNMKRLTSTMVFRAHNIPEPGFIQTFAGGQKELECLSQGPDAKASMAEQGYAISLKELIPSALGSLGPSNITSISTRPAAGRATGPPQLRNNKLRLIQGVAFNEYCDLIVEVVKKFPDVNGHMELYVTDYTPNDSLYDYPSPSESSVDDVFSRDGDFYGYLPNVSGKRKDWTGPSGKHTLKVELLPPHAGFARDRVREGDYVLLQNVRIKLGNGGKMEGNLWTDSSYPDKVCVHRLERDAHPELKTLLNRRSNYWGYHNKKIATELNKPENQEKTESKKTKTQKRKEAKLRKRNPDNTASVSASDAILSNKHVTCMQISGVDMSTLGEIQSRNYTYNSKSGQELALPFLNVRNRVRVRVVDFWPPALEDFAKLAQPNEIGKTLEDGGASECDTDMLSLPSQRWVWDFFLLLEDIKSHRAGHSPAQQWVHVNHTYAEFLIGMEEDATDLRSDSETLAKLREQMAVLWGNLEELKSTAVAKQQPYPAHSSAPIEGMELSNLPFCCCIEEYGQKLDEADLELIETPLYERIHEMFGAHIF